MPVVSFEDLKNRVTQMLGEAPDDTGLSLLEDMTDTLAVDWQKKYTENDNAWRKRYKERFGSGPPEGGMEPEPSSPTPKILTINDLFTPRKSRKE